MTVCMHGISSKRDDFSERDLCKNKTSQLHYYGPCLIELS